MFWYQVVTFEELPLDETGVVILFEAKTSLLAYIIKFIG